MKTIALLGAPNTGKSTLFNNLTKSDEHVGNWHGVTVSKTQKIIEYKNEKYTIIDLAGIYSLNPYSMEEIEPSQFVANSKDEIFVCVCDSENLKRGLYLLLQILELDKPCILALNIFNKNRNIEKIIKKIKTHLKIELIFHNFNKLHQLSLFYNKINAINKNINNFDYLKKMPLSNLEKIFSKVDKDKARFLSLRFLEGSNDYIALQNLTKDDLDYLTTLRSLDTPMLLASARYDFIEQILNDEINQKLTIKKDEKLTKKVEKKSVNFDYKNNNFTYSKIDKILLNKFLAFPIFLLVMFVVFYLTFSSIGALLSEWFECGINYLGRYVNTVLEEHCKIEWINSLISDAIIGGVGSILVFLPQVFLLFFFLGTLEQSGYLSRMAYILEDFLSKIGLTGKSAFTWLMGFGCTATAVLTAQNLNNKNDKIKTIISTGFIPCSAKLPVLAVLGGAFFGAGNVLVIFLFYILSSLIGVLIALLLEKTILPQEKGNFILEFARYNQPFNKSLFRSTLNSTKHFLSKVGGFLIVFSVVIWFLQSFNFSFNYILNSNSVSMIQQISQFFAPLFAPLGLGEWGIVSCLIAGLVAKELIVASIGIINGVGSNGGVDSQIGASLLLSTSVISLNLSSCLSLITFIMLYVPCLATYSTMRSLIGKKYTLFAYLLMLITAYIVSYLVYKIALIYTTFGLISTIFLLFFVIFISILIVKLINFLFNKNKKCYTCSKCNICKNK